MVGMLDTIKLMVKGGIIGIAFVIPGVSGGTLAVVLGIYQDLIEAISNFFTNSEKRKTYFWFLFKVLLGAAAIALLFILVMDFLLTYYEIYTYLFFIGAIAGSIPAIYRTHPDMKLTVASVITFILAIALIVVIELSFSKPASDAVKLSSFSFDLGSGVMLLVSGMLAGGSMIVPGISGSFILVLLGQYHVVIRIFKTVDYVPIIFFLFGILLGIWVFAKIIDILLKRYPKETFYFILGLVIASLFSIFPGIPTAITGKLIGVVVLIVAGYLSLKLGDRIQR
jgi:putative membrane protein